MEKLENRNVLIDTNLIIQHLRIRNKSQSALMEVSVLAQELTILPFDSVAAEKAAEIYLDLRHRGMMIEFRDIFIAATALVHNLPIKTLNTKDFERIGGLVLV